MEIFMRRMGVVLVTVLFFVASCLPWAGAYGLGTRSTASSMTHYSLMSGVTESAVALSDGDQGFMLQVAPTAKARMKVSYSKYFTAGSSKTTRSAAASTLGYTVTRTTDQAAAYEEATSRNVIFAMNGNFAFDTGEPMGLIKVEGNVIHPSDSNAKIYFAILKDGSYAFRTYTDDHSDVAEAVAGRQWLVRDGKQIKQNTEQLSARTAIGLKADGTLVAFVVNGKTNSYGVTINDMSELMFSLGCVNAINLDGGGSSLFATQRAGSSDLTIRNSPSDSNGERAVTSTLLLVTEPQSDRLYFDFTDDMAARSRYAADIYGGNNFDTGSWHYHHTYSTAPVFDNTAGTMSFSTTSAHPATRHIHPVITSLNSSYTGGHPLRYVPTGNDYFKVRMKIRGSMDTDADFRLMYATDDGNESTAVAWSGAIPAEYINGDYFILEGKLTFKEVDAITAIRPEVYNLLIDDPTKTTVQFTYDYIYVGPETGARTPNFLLFDFSDNQMASSRYDTVPYGFMNFDRSSNGYWATAYNSSVSAFSVDNTQGLLHVEVTDGYSGTAEAGNLTYGPWIKTTNTYGKFTGRTTYSYFPLSFAPEDCDIVQIRFKTENCLVPTGKTPVLVMEYYYTQQDAHNYKNDIRQSYSLSNGVFQTLTIPVSATFKTVDMIKCMGLRFQNIKGDGTGKISIDYIYVGPSCGAPDAIHTWDGGSVTMPATCTEPGIKTYTCSACKTTRAETIEPLGHSCSYTRLDGRLHAVTCENCGLSEEEVHSYTEGVCVCGEPESKEPVEDTALKLNHSLNLASDISVNLLVSKTLLEGFDMDTVYVEATVDTYEGNTKTGTETIRIAPVDSEYYYYFTLDGLTAVQMNDRISSVLYGTKDGQPYYSPVDEYSISSYAYSQLNKTETGEGLKTLCADLLRYGAKAQIFKGYRTDSLADGAMTEEQKAYLSDIDAVTFGNTNTVLNDLENAPVAWAGKVLNLESKVALKFVFHPVNYHGSVEDLALRIFYADVYGNTKTGEFATAELYNRDLGYYAFSVDTLLAAELRSVVSVQIYEGDTPVSCTLQYSADTYGNNKTGALLDLCKALFAYSDSAKAYFAP